MTESNLPPAARKQVKEANRLVAEQKQNMTAANRPGFVPAAAAPAQTPGVADAPAPQAQPVAEPAPDPVRALEHKYSVLQGKYNAETSRLLGAAQALKAENDALMARLAAQSQQQAPTPRAEDRFDTSVVTQKEREEFGEELVEMMARIAKANSAAEVAVLRNQLAQMQGQVAQTQQIGTQTRMERTWQALDANVPNWRVINDSQQFLDWLQDIDIMSGVARQAGLHQAFERGDSARVVGIFKRFLQEDSSTGSTSQPAAAQVNRETLIAPSQGRGGEGAPNGVNKQVYTEQDIDEFYSRVQRKRIDPAEAAAFEKELQLAVKEGRVIPRRDDRHLANSR